MLEQIEKTIYKVAIYIRLSKEDAVDEKITIVDSGDSIHLKVKIAAYPAKKEIAIKKVREAIENN